MLLNYATDLNVVFAIIASKIGSGRSLKGNLCVFFSHKSLLKQRQVARSSFIKMRLGQKSVLLLAAWFAIQGLSEACIAVEYS